MAADGLEVVWRQLGLIRSGVNDGAEFGVEVEMQLVVV
jgi:hypothetical protein